MSAQEQYSAFDIVPWNPSFETGVEVIDQQHQQLVKLLNELAHQYVYGLEPDQLEQIVDGLVDYAAYHFETEEALWADVFSDDEWLVKHQRSHNGFVEKVRAMQRKAANTANTAGLSSVDDLLSFLVSWLAHHILHDDKTMSAVLLGVDNGLDLPVAKQKAIEAMSGQASGLIQSVLAMYKQLSGRTLALQREAYAREQAERALKERDARLLISEFAADFMTSPPEDFDATIERVLQRGGEHMKADRTFVFLLSDHGQYMSATHEWCAPGIESEIDNLQCIPSDSTPWWWQQLRNPGYVLVPCVSEMPAEAHQERLILEARNARSVCVYPLYAGDRLAGFLGNSAVKNEHHWGREVLGFLKLMSDLLGIALDHLQLQQKRAQVTSRLERAEQLAHLGHWSYQPAINKAIWSQEVFRIFQRDPDTTVPDHQIYFEMIHPEDRKKAHDAFQQAKVTLGFLHTEHRVVLDSGQIKHVEVRGQFEAGPGGTPALIEGTVQDVSEKAEHRQQLRRLAYEDSLTGLPNRRALEGQLQREIEYCDAHGQKLVLVLLDLDNFREANDRYGPAVGDDVLVALSQRMRRLFAEPVMAGRVSGDGFLVLLPQLAATEDYFLALRRLLAAINEPLRFGNIELVITASIGVTEYPQAARVSGEHLLRQAQQALFQAKMRGKNRFQQYDVNWEHSTQALTDRLEAIKNGLAANEFVLHYQPKVDMISGAVVGVEALIRWQKPDGELLPPGAFLPALQDHPLEIELGDWVIRSALSQLTAWQAEGLSVPVSINVASQQLLEEAFIDKLAAAFDDYPGVEPQALQIEILESSALNDLEKVSRVIWSCRQLGVDFALDDFGTGFSSLSYLKHLPASVLKIDQSFVRGMLDNPDDLSIISGVIGMAQAFGLQVIAEGVETVEHGELLLRLGCQLGQGYGIARAMKAEDLSGWIQSWKAPLSWGRQKPADSQGTPLLYAEVEHRHWIKQLEAWLSGGAEHAPVMDPRRCLLGQWIASEGHARFSGRPEFQALLKYHGALHQAGKAAIAARDKGKTQKVPAALSDVYKEQDRVMSALRALGDSPGITG